MNETEFICHLEQALFDSDDLNETTVVSGCRSFQAAMLLTSDQGMVITLDSGEEFQVTVVRSK